MKLDDEQSGLVPVDKAAASNVPVTNPQQHRSMPIKRVVVRPSTQDITPAALSGTEKIKAELESAILPIFEQMDDDEWNDAASVVSSLIPRAIAHRSSQREERIAANVRTLAGEVGKESLATFQIVNDSNSTLLTSMADALFVELCQV